MPGAKVFIDSTTFLYSHDIAEQPKRERARNWLESLALAQAGISNLQVLNEVTNTLIRKPARFGGDDPFYKVDVFSSFGQSELTSTASRSARLLHHRYRYSWWDCLLLASAIELGCTHFLSEDLQDGQIIDGPTTKGLTIVDPFAHTPEQILVSP